jgi:hypothetical protein
LRFSNLGLKSLWLDEVIQAGQARFHSLGEVIASTRLDDQMPLLNVITWLMRGGLPNEALVRMPSAVAGLLTVVGIYLLGRALFGYRAGLIAALLTALWPFAVAYSQEARPYALLIMATTFQMYFAYQVVVRRRWIDGLGLAVASLITLYSHYMGLAATAAAAAFVGLALGVQSIADLRRYPGWRQAAVHAFQAAIPALIAAVLIVIGYLPWVGTLREFLHRPTVGFARFAGEPHHLTVSDVQSMLAAFDFTGPLLLLFVIGVAACIWWAARGKRLAAGLLAAWIIVPLAGLVLKLHGSIALLHPRYLSFLLPAGILLVTAGIEAVASLFANRFRRRGYPVAGVAAVILTLAVTAQLLPQTVSALQTPKDDYLGAANLIVGSSPGDSVVLAVGTYSEHVMVSLGYYLQVRHSPIALMNGSYLDDRSVARIEQSRGAVWGALFTSYAPNDLERASTGGLELHRFTGVTVIRWPSGSASATDQAKSLLRWASSFEPRDRASAEFLDRGRTSSLGPSLLPTAPEPFVLRAQRGETSVLNATVDVTPGEDLLATFSYRNPGFSGQQLLLIAAADRSGQIVQEFPARQDFQEQVKGYQCLSTTDWTPGAFAFRVPLSVTSLTIWLRAAGTGVAEFQDVKLRRL